MFLVKNLTLVHEKNCVLFEVSAELQQGTVTAFIGESGAGKSSLLRCLAQLEPNYTGIITYKNMNIRSYSPSQLIAILGFVSSHIYLFPHLSVLENCTLPLQEVLSVELDTAQEKANTWLAALGIADIKHSYPEQLSTGQQYRVLLARALMFGPQMLILDEITAGLDPRSRALVIDVIKKLRATGVGIVLATNDMALVKNVADRIYFLEHGRIVEQFDAAEPAPLTVTPLIGAFFS